MIRKNSVMSKTRVTASIASWMMISAMLVVCASGQGCFGGSGSESAFQGGPEVVEGGVVFRYYDPKAARVNLVGDFNSWSPRTDAMMDKNGDGQWTLYFNLAPGVYQYKFVVDGVRWIPDPKNPERVSDGFEGENSVLRVPEPSTEAK